MQPFDISVPDSVLDDLHMRLRATRWPDQLDGVGWDYGTDRAYLQELCAYWLDGYDWRAQEAKLNALPNFTAPVNGFNLHFLHARAERDDALPLILQHGWPGSTHLFHKVVEPLAYPEHFGGDPADAFHVVCPSMPGYGFSDAPRQRGFDVREVARTNLALMTALGYDRFAAQGGDWGAHVTTWTAALAPERVRAIHLNMSIGKRPKSDAWKAKADPAELADLERTRNFGRAETGYQAIQATKPQTLSYGLQDSPVGLAGWIVEKYRSWSDCGGDIEARYSKDDLLTHVMIYWINGNIGASMRLYYETFRARSYGSEAGYIETPTGCALFPKEISLLPRAYVDECFNVVRWTRMPRGGHFAASEEPELFVDDVRQFFREYRA